MEQEIFLEAKNKMEKALEHYNHEVSFIRTGRASTLIPGFIEGKHEVFPIPQQEVDISGLTQNTGY